jgi:hypothetical protein
VGETSVEQPDHFFNFTGVSWERLRLDLNESLKSNNISPIQSFMMGMKRKRITMDLKSPIEEAFFARLEQKEWPSLMRLILRDAIRTGRAQELKHENCFHFDETPLASDGTPFSDDGRIGDVGNPPAFCPAERTSTGDTETDPLQHLPDQIQPASQAKHAAAPDWASSKIPPSSATVVPRAHLGSSIPRSALSPVEAMELMNLNIDEVRGACTEPIQAHTADRLATSKMPVTQAAVAAVASPLSPEVAPARGETATPTSPAEAPSASMLKGFFGEPGRDRPS